MYPEDLKYSKEHEWVKVESGVATIGISHFAQDSLGDIVFVELPQVGDTVEVDDVIGSIESVKAVSDIFSPVGGEVTAANESLEDKPELINNDPYGEGWIYRIKLSSEDVLESLMDAQAYQEFIAAEDS